MKNGKPDRGLYLALALLPDPGPGALKNLLNFAGKEEWDIGAISRLSPMERRMRLPAPVRIHTLLDQVPGALEKSRELAPELERRGISWLPYTDSGYPSRLNHFLVESSPIALFYQGNKSILNSPYFLGIIGTRKATRRNFEAAKRMATETAREGVVIVSGGADGIDTAAHLGALEAGSTIIIPPWGLFNTKRLFELQRRFTPSNHLVLSEFPPYERGTKSTPILRNRIVAALSDALLVVETGVRSGTLHTVKLAREMGKPILAADFSPGKNPAGNASLLNTIATRLPASSAAKKEQKNIILEAVKKGKKLLDLKPATQHLLFK